jgi:hypothetical protein
MKLVDQIPAEWRAAYKAELLAGIPIPAPFEVEGISITISNLAFDSRTGHLVVYLTAARGEQVLIEHDEDFRFQNPPVKVPDPEGRTFLTHHPRGSFERELHVEDLDAALKAIVADTVLITLAHRGL